MDRKDFDNYHSYSEAKKEIENGQFFTPPDLCHLVAAAPDTLKEYKGDTPLKIMAAVEMTAQWEHEIVAIGVRHQNVLDAYAAAIREYLPGRPLFTVTGSTRTFAQRRALRRTLRDSRNGILLCTQQSLPSSVNLEYVNKILIPEMHYNNSGMSQFYIRFIRYTSTEDKDIYFLNYTGSLESNLLQMVMAKEKINLFMKGQDANLGQIYDEVQRRLQSVGSPDEPGGRQGRKISDSLGRTEDYLILSRFRRNNGR